MISREALRQPAARPGLIEYCSGAVKLGPKAARSTDPVDETVIQLAIKMTSCNYNLNVFVPITPQITEIVMISHYGVFPIRRN